IVCEVGVSKSIISVCIINSRGVQANYKKSIFSLGIEGNLVRGTDMLFVGEDEISCHLLANTKAVTESVLLQLERAKEQASLSSRSLPVIFTPNGVASALISPLMAAFNGKLVLEGASPIGSKIGQQIFNKDLWLWDDPTLDYRPMSRSCDDEGIPSQRTPLIVGGKVANFFYDLQTAGLAHAKSTGNGGRNRGGLPSPSPSAFVIAPGKVTFNEMINNIEEGLIIDQLMGGQQGNILGGDFSGNVLLGFKVKNGNILGRVKNTMISGNIYQILKQISIGDEAKWVGSFLNTPHLYCPSLSITTMK
ncbi:metallopeptidase TldD-related protein, partial [Chloroflexota bacterium]